MKYSLNPIDTTTSHMKYSLNPIDTTTSHRKYSQEPHSPQTFLKTSFPRQLCNSTNSLSIVIWLERLGFFN